MPEYIVLNSSDTPTGETVTAATDEQAYDLAVAEFGLGVSVEPVEG